MTKQSDTSDILTAAMNLNPKNAVDFMEKGHSRLQSLLKTFHSAMPFINAFSELNKLPWMLFSQR